MVKVTSDKDLQALVASSRIVLLYFFVDWDEPSMAIKDSVEVVAKRPTVPTVVAEINAEESEDLATKYGVRSAPTFVFLLDGKVAGSVEGANIPKLAQALDGVASSAVTSTVASAGGAAQPSSSAKELNERIAGLIAQQPVMLFMKGSPDEPRCGFSRRIVELLRRNNVLFGSFDIFSDEDVRQGIKTYSNFPTFPQLYINNELVGGLDVATDLESSGELASMIPAGSRKAN